MLLIRDLSSSLQIIWFSSQSNYSLKLLQQRLSSTKQRKSSRSKRCSLIPTGIGRSGLYLQAVLPTLAFNLYLTYNVNQMVNILPSLNSGNPYSDQRQSVLLYEFLSSNLKHS